MRWFLVYSGLLLAGVVGMLVSLPGRTAACAFSSAPMAYEGPSDRSLYLKTIELAAFDLLFPGDPYFGLPPIERGTRANRSTDAPRQVPAVLLKAMSWVESATMQASLATRFNTTGPALISFDCGHGVMQVTSGMTRPLGEKGLPTLQQAFVATHFAYNIARGAWILADTWNKAPENSPIAGTDTDGDPGILENWYFAVWQYNGFTGPGDNRSNHPLDPIYGSWPRLPFSCGPADDGLGHDRSRYPYQELVFGCVANPPRVNGAPLWEPQPINLPDLNDPRWKGPLSLTNFQPPYTAMDIPTPASPTPTPTLTPTPTPTRSSGTSPLGTRTPLAPPTATPALPPHSLPARSLPTRGLPTRGAQAGAQAGVQAGENALPDLPAQAGQPVRPGHRDTTQRPDPSLRSQILGQPQPSLSTDSVTLTFTPNGRSDSATVEIANIGSGILSWLAVPSEPWIIVRPPAGVALDESISCDDGCQRTGSLSISVDTAALRLGRYQGTVQILTGSVPLTLSVSAEGPASAQRAGRHDGTAKPMRRFQRPLVRGWNLISIPVQVSDPAPRSLFREISQSLQAVFTYDGRSWLAFSPSAPEASDLKEIRPGMGLWVRMRAPEELTVSGTPPPAKVDITLEEGWNLIGFPGLSARPVAEALASILGNYTAVYSYEARLSAWRAFSPNLPAQVSDLTQLEPGYGYWVRVSKRVTWSCPCGEEPEASTAGASPLGTRTPVATRTATAVP